MKSLISLDLSENEIGDVGITEVVRSIKNYGSLEYLDISGNSIGKTTYSIELSDLMHSYLG
jgi:Leucine-rich repeat (LRR) protein